MFLLGRYKKQVHRQILSPAADPIKENEGQQGVNGGELPNIHIEHSTPIKQRFVSTESRLRDPRIGYILDTSCWTVDDNRRVCIALLGL
jgi:hypothetical protein